MMNETKNTEMSKAIKFNTNGKGTWTTKASSVGITNIKLCKSNPETGYAELRVYFDRAEWSVRRDGLIYGDPRFLKDLKAFFKEHNLPTSIDYTEQGMQGFEFVSFTASPKFVKAWNVKFDLE